MTRHERTPASAGINLGLIITPMLDMSFQILAFFIMTYHPSALEAQVPGNLALPEPASSTFSAGEPKLSDPADPLEPEGTPVVVRIRAMMPGQAEGKRLPGMPRELAIKVGMATVAFDVVAGSAKDFEKDDLRALEQRLRDVMKDEGKSATIRIVADGELRQMYVMQVYDACKSAGFGKINFAPPPMNGGR